MSASYAELVASRREWIEGVLRPWCRQASPRDLAIADSTWADLAGRVSPQFTLWMWAWSRFPGLVIDELQRFDEAVEVRVTLKDGRAFTGFPDARDSQRDQLAVATRQGISVVALDDVASLESLRTIAPVPDRAITPSPE